MSYLAGIDGGATKTRCVIGDDTGKVLSQGLASGSNYQLCGEEIAENELRKALEEALAKAGITVNEIQYTVFGLAGADLQKDFAVLDTICGRILGNKNFKVLNDSWNGLRAGSPEYYGVVANCGTGSCFSGRSRDGREITLRNLSYETGNYGGGNDLIRDALHHAFRSDEGTGPKTRLEEEIPRLSGFDKIDDIIETVIMGRILDTKLADIPKLVFRLATEGDRMCQDILIKMGRHLGETAGSVAKRLKLDKDELPVILTGSVFKGKNPLLIDEFTTTIHRLAPYAKIVISKLEPAIGAYLLALDEYVKRKAF